MKKSFKGLLIDGAQDRIKLSTLKGQKGYRITKFETMGKKPGQHQFEHVTKIYQVKQTTIDHVVDFTDSNLLGVSYLTDDAAAGGAPVASAVIFDLEVFNQDIYVTFVDYIGSESCNYYIELEVIDLSSAMAEYITIKDLRANA